MKEYNVKYDINQMVYILTNKNIYKSSVEKIRITEGVPYCKIIGNEAVEQSGITIEYLVIISDEPYGLNGSTMTSYDWYNQDSVFETKEDLIRSI